MFFNFSHRKSFLPKKIACWQANGTVDENERFCSGERPELRREKSSQ